MPFEPQQHLIKLPRRVKDKAAGQYVTVHDDYFEVRWRVLMFRERYPHGVITTEEIAVDLDRGYARYKATLQDGEGGIATGYGTETQADFGDYAERAETRALGRALAVLGFGTQFVGQDLTEGEHVADEPVPNGHSAPPAMEPPSTNGQAAPTTPPNGKEHPTEVDITALTTLAVVTCHEDSEVFAQRLRTIMRLKVSASVAPRLLTQTMSMAQYQEAMAYYTRLQAQLARPNETASPDTPASIPAQPPAPEEPPAGPFAVSSAPEASTDAADPGPNTPEGYATPESIKALKRLAAQVGPEAAEDLEDVLSHAPKGLMLDLYRRIEARLQARLNGHKMAVVA